MGWAQRKQAYAHASTRPALHALPPLELDELLGTPVAVDTSARGPLFDRHPVDLLRKMVRRSTAEQFSGWSNGIGARDIAYIIGVTTDDQVFYSDGIGMSACRLPVFQRYLRHRIHAAKRAGKPYDPLVRDFLYHGGHLPPPPDHGC